jgi:hypothetical protein
MGGEVVKDKSPKLSAAELWGAGQGGEPAGDVPLVGDLLAASAVCGGAP